MRRKGLRRAGGREGAGAGYSLPVPRACMYLKDLNRLSGDPGGPEADYIIFSARRGLLVHSLPLERTGAEASQIRTSQCSGSPAVS